MKLSYFIILSSLLILQSCIFNKKKEDKEMLFSFSCTDYGDPKFDSQIYLNDTLLIVKNYGIAHSEKIIVDSTFIIALKGNIVSETEHHLYFSMMKNMRKIPIDEFIKTICEEEKSKKKLKDNTDSFEFVGCDFIDITGDLQKELFLMKSSPDYWDSFTTYISVYQTKLMN